MFSHLKSWCKGGDGKCEGYGRWVFPVFLIVATLWVGAKFISEAKGIKGEFPNVPTITVTGE